MPTPLKVLIIEDRPADAELMVYELERVGFAPAWRRVDNEANYLAQLGTNPDIILADHTLPEFDAPKALELLKARGLDIPFIVVTGSISEETAVDRLKQGASDYILKDRMARLGDAVTRALREKQLREEKQRAEDALRVSEAKFRALIDFAPDAIVGIKRDGRIAIVNAQTEKLFGYSREELLDQPMEMLVPERLRAAHLRHRTGYLSAPKMRPMGAGLDLYGQRKDGSEFPLEVSLSPLETADGLLVTGIIRDITDRKRAEEEIQQNMDRIRALHEIDVAITSTLDLDTVLRTLLEKMDLFLSYSTATVRLFNELTGLLEPVACRNLDEEEWKARQWSAGRGSANIVFETRTPVMIRDCYTDPRIKDPVFFRKHRLVSYLGVPLLAKDEILGVLSVYTQEEHDFTNKEIEFLNTLAGQAAIAIHNARLFEQTRSQTEQLQTANKVKDEFLSVMSHELRTPLSVVMGYTGMMKEKMLGEINPQQEDALQKVLSRAAEQLHMINSIMQTTQIEARAMAVERHLINLSEFLAHLKSDYELTRDNRKVALVWDYPSEPVPIVTDSGKLRQILQNLLDNAAKFTDRGTVTVSLAVTEKNGKRWLELKVADTGIGIAGERIPRVFEKFYQVDSSETRLYGGVGLGLYIVKRFTDLLGGTIDVDSEPGKGSTFTVRLPYEN